MISQGMVSGVGALVVGVESAEGGAVMSDGKTRREIIQGMGLLGGCSGRGSVRRG